MTKPRTFYPIWLAVLLALAGLAFTAVPAFACGGSVICVNDNAPGPTHDGQSWSTAYNYLQDALAAATTGNEIWVAEGVYYPDEGAGQTANNPAATFRLKKNVEIYGGFAATETLRTQRDWDTHITVLSGDLGGDDVTDAHGVALHWTDVATTTDNTHQIVTAGYWNGGDITVDATAVLDGFTITAGRDFRNAILEGAGAGLFTYKSNPTLRHLVFSGNQARAGGGIYLWEGPAITMTDLTFTGNAATQGGGLYCRDIPLTLDQFVFQNNETRNFASAVQSGGGMATTCNLTLTNGQFTGNTAGSAGGLSTNGGPVSLSHVVFDSNRATEGNSGAGGMVSEAGNPALTDVTFVKNSSNGWGGGYYHQNSALSFTRVSFIDNVNAWGYGGGLAVVNAPTVITDALFAGNLANNRGGGMIAGGADLTMTNVVFQGNTLTGAYREGGGLFVYGSMLATLQNVTFAGNNADKGGGINVGYYSWGEPAARLQMSNSIVYGNTTGAVQVDSGSVATVTYSIVADGCPGRSTCDHVNDTDPAFVLPVVQSDVPTSTGNLRLRSTSPAIDAGDNSAVPAGLTTDLDGNPRLVDTPAVADTGSGTPPLVDRGAYEYPGKPDLEISKTNTVGGVVATNTPFSWTLTLSNTGGDTATFANGKMIFRDHVPFGASYGLPSIQNAVGLSGPIKCSDDSDLRCWANGGPVTLAAAGRFTVVIPVTPTTISTLTNPRDGICAVDPDEAIPELWENNNACNSDTVAVGQTTLTAEIHNAGHTVITSAPLSETIHGQATVVGASGGITPTGQVTLTLHDNDACDPPALATDVKPLVNGVAESSDIAARSFYYRVRYSGDSTHEALSSPCTLFSAYQPGPAFTVNTAADDGETVDSSRCTDIHCTLREAILAANAAAGANTILFAIGSGQTITLTLALPAINDSSGELTIDGQAYAVTVSGANQYRLFTASHNARATLANLTLVNGHNTVPECGPYSCGGGLKVEAGAAVTLTHSAILSSTAHYGGGIYNVGNLTIRQSTLAGNSANAGGGLLVGGGMLTLENSTLSGNSVTGTDPDASGGGAIDLYSGAAAITNSTIVSNTAASPNQARSGIWLEENGTLTMRNSIVAHNNGTNNFQRSAGTFTSQGYNLSNAWNSLAIQSTDLTGNPQVGPLADNGGATRTHALLSGSPAIDGGDPGDCPAADQRDISRPQGLRCDIGAVEITPALAMTKSVLPAGNVPYHSVVTYTLVLTNSGGTAAANLILTDTLPAGVAFGQWLQQPGSGLVQNSSAFTWTGDLAASAVLTFSFTATHTGSALEVITNTAFFSGTLQKGSGAATFNVLCPHTLTVQNTNDSGPGSLREAIADVCEGGTVDFAPALAGQTIGLTSAELAIAKTVTITNPSAPGLQISGHNARRVLYIEPSGVVTLSSLSVVSGTADYGGAIFNYGMLTVNNSTFSGHQADYGGGIFNYGMLTVNASAFSGNQADYGGGILNGGTLTAHNSTFSGNQAGNEGGGGILNYGTLILTNTIIANSPSGGDCRNSSSEPVSTNANNLIEATGSNACDLANGAGGSLIGLDPLLAPLGDYGGSTPTFALLPGSPAINAGDQGEGCLPTDQRGVARPQAGGCDIGAFESRGFSLTYGSGSDQSTRIDTVFPQPLTLTVSSSAAEPVNGGQVILTGPGSGAGTNPAVYTATIGGPSTSSGQVTQVVTANNTAGSYIITATARGNLGSAASYTLTNTAPNIAVLGNGVEIAGGDITPDPADHTDFGSAAVTGGEITRTFTISNSGGASLHLTGAPLISITGPAALDFSLVTSPTTPISSGETTTFQVRFDPSLTGTRAATLTIASDDGDENPYVFAIQGTGTIPTVQFTQAAYQVNEDGAAVGATVSLTRTGQVEGVSRVQVSFADNTATGGTDYTDAPITLTFPAGDSGAQTVSVPITQDFLVEPSESLTLTVTSLSNAQIGSQDTAALQIVDDDAASIEVNPTSLTIVEPDMTGVFTLTLGSQPTAPVTITLTSTATNECSVPTQVVLNASNWQTGMGVSVTAIDDPTSDGPQLCGVQSSAASSDATYNGRSVADVTVTVNDDDIPGVILFNSSVSVGEGGPTATYTIRLNTVPTATVTLSVAAGGEINPVTDLLFAADLTALDPQTVTVTATDDTVVEGDHSQVIGHLASGGGYDGVGIGQVTAAISDNDLNFAIAAGQASGNEGSGTNTPLSFSVTRSGGITGTTATVNFTIGGEVDAGDYQNLLPAAGVVSFGSGESQKSITLDVVGDFVVEPNETLTVTISSPSGPGSTYLITATAQTGITNDDSAGFTLNPASLTVGEPAGVATFTLKLTSQPVASVTVNLTAGDVTECVVSPKAATLNWTNWQRGVTMTVTAVADNLADGDQPCVVNGVFSSGDGSYHNRTFNLTVTVKDIGLSPIYLPLISNGFTLAVPSGPDLVIDRLSSSSSGPSVTIRNAGGSATADAFWVDVYFNPTPAPPPLNRTWQSIASHGAHWGVTQPLAPGETLTLTLNGPYYASGSSSFPAGARVYAYVDSINYATTYGNIKENNEANNVFGPIVSTAAALVSPAPLEAAQPEGLPER